MYVVKSGSNTYLQVESTGRPVFMVDQALIIDNEEKRIIMQDFIDRVKAGTHPHTSFCQHLFPHLNDAKIVSVTMGE